MDETLLQTGHLHGEYQVKILREYGIHDITQHDIPSRFGSQSSRVWMPNLLNERGVSFNKQVLEQQILGKNRYIKQKIADGEVALMPHATEAIHDLFNNDYAMAIGTGSEADIVEIFLDVYGFRKYISAIASCYDDNPQTGRRINSKPSPEVCEVALYYLEEQFGHLPKASRFNKYMIGDTEDDVICGSRANVVQILIPNSRLQKDLKPRIAKLRKEEHSPIVLQSLKGITTILQNIY